MKKKILLVSVLAVASCSGSAKISQGNDASASVFQPNKLTTASAQISAATGGYINVGAAQLRIPAQALDRDTTITAEIADISLPAGSAQAVGKGIRLKPEGLQFLNPAELEICYSASEAAALHESNAQIYYHTEDNQYVAIAGTVDINRHCVKSHIEHFSSYVAAAVAQVPGNTAPVIGGANFLPATPMAGIPLRVRTAINDTNGSTPIGSTVPGTVVTAFFYYRTVGAATFNKVALQPDNTDDTVTNRYFYQIPANEVTTAGIEYYFEATDNLNVLRRLPVTVGTYVTRTVPGAATAIRFNPAGLTPAGELHISAGFMRALTLQASDGTAWQNIAIDNAMLSNPALGLATLSGPSSVRFKALGALTGTIASTSGVFSATTNIAVVPGLLTHIEITDVNQVILTGTLNLPASQVYNFDVIGFDIYGNVATILPLITTTGSIGSISTDLTGAHLSTAASLGNGSIVADIAGITDSLNVNIYMPPQVTATAPFNNTAGIAVNASIGVSFSHVMDTSTLTTGTTTACTGSLQVSADNFATCVPMVSASPAFYASNTLAVIQPAANLAGLTTYQIRVKAFVMDTNGHAMVGDYTTPIGFTTVAVPPTVISLDPVDGAVSVATSTAIGITFSQAMNPATLTASVASACTGSIQLSADNFVTCIAMGTTVANMTGGDTVASFTPAVSLAGNTTYRIRVTTAAQSALGLPMANSYTQVTGFTTQISVPTGWYSVTSGITDNLNAVAFVPGTNVAYSASELGVVLRSADQGESWSAVATAPVDTHYSLRFNSSTTGLLTSAAHIYAISAADTNPVFTDITNNAAGMCGPFKSPVILSATKVLVACGDAVIQTLDGGATWALVFGLGSGATGTMAFKDSLNGSYRRGSFVKKTIDGGANWSDITIPGLIVAGTAWDMLYTANDNVISAGNYVQSNGIPLRISIDGGLTFSLPTIPSLPATVPGGFITVGIRSLTQTGASTLFGVGNNQNAVVKGLILRSDDNGLNWVQQVSPVSTTLLSVSFLNPAVGLAVGLGGNIIKTQGGGF